MILLIDAGNTRIKARRYQDGEWLAERHSQATGDDLSGLVSGNAPRRVLVSNVAGEAFAEALMAKTLEHWDMRPEFAKVEAQSQGLICAYPAPERLGIDRWMALLAGWKAHAAVCVADTGTAITVDVADAEGLHLGGVITPGVKRMYDSLAGNAAGIPAHPLPEGGADWLAADTASALASGSLQAALGFLERMAAACQHLSDPPPRLILTGGDGPLLMPLLESQWLYAPDLVLEGLLIQFNEKDS